MLFYLKKLPFLVCLLLALVIFPTRSFASLNQTSNSENFDYIIKQADFSFSSEDVNNQNLTNVNVTENIAPNKADLGKDITWMFPLLSYSFQDKDHFHILDSDPELVKSSLKITDDKGDILSGDPIWDKFGQSFSIIIHTQELKTLPSLIKLSFTSRSVVYQLGKVSNFELPYQGESWGLDENAKITITTPDEVFYINPQPSSETEDPNYNFVYTYHGSDLKTTGLDLQLGQTQEFQFSISATIPKLDTTLPFPLNIFQTRLFSLTLPSNQDQDIAYQNLSPKPDWTYIKPGGNGVVAYYFLPISQSQIKVSGIATILPLSISNKYTLQAITEASTDKLAKYQDYTEYLSADHYIDKDNPEVASAAQKLDQGKNNVFQIAQADYDFVVSKINYNDQDFYALQINDNTSAIHLQTASEVLQSRKGICSEYAFLLIALLRDQHIPAKFVAGTSITPAVSLPELHAWVEALIPNVGWIPLDPTWGNIRRHYIGEDLDHLMLYQTAVGDANANLWSISYPPNWNQTQVTSYIKNIDDSYQFSMEPLSLSALADIKTTSHRIDLINFDHNLLSDKINNTLSQTLQSSSNQLQYSLQSLLLPLEIFILYNQKTIITGLAILVILFVLSGIFIVSRKLIQRQSINKII